MRQLAENDDTERGAVYTKPEIVGGILDLTGYTPDRPLHRLRLLEPSFGAGDFLLPAIDRLLHAYRASGGTPESAAHDLGPALRAVELHTASLERTAGRVRQRLTGWGLEPGDAAALTRTWLIHDDFLLTYLSDAFDVIVGNPPYVRQERIPEALLAEYRRRYWTIYDRADLYVPFFERGLDLLSPGGKLGFICANRWMKNRYGGPLREKITRKFRLAYFIDMEHADAFHSDVIAYPAITVIERPLDTDNPRPTRIGRAQRLSPGELPDLVHRMIVDDAPDDERVVEVTGVANGREPWLTANAALFPLLRQLEERFPALEDAACKVGIGVATGADRVFIGPYDELPVEDSRKLPLVMAGDLKLGRIDWGGKGIINPFEPDGTLASLDEYPLFQAYIEAHRPDIQRRHVARKNPGGWYRTIDRIYPELTSKPKLLIPDIKGTAAVVYGRGTYYTHHNLYFVTSAIWDLRALQTILRSSVAVMFVAAYCTRMAGGFLRFQAQYLRRIRVPRWEHVPQSLRSRLIDPAEEPDTAKVDAVVFDLYGLTAHDAEMVAEAAARAQIIPKREQRTP